jgi:hypothetical protein
LSESPSSPPHATRPVKAMPAPTRATTSHRRRLVLRRPMPLAAQTTRPTARMSMATVLPPAATASWRAKFPSACLPVAHTTAAPDDSRTCAPAATKRAITARRGPRAPVKVCRWRHSHVASESRTSAQLTWASTWPGPSPWASFPGKFQNMGNDRAITAKAPSTVAARLRGDALRGSSVRVTVVTSISPCRLVRRRFRRLGAFHDGGTFQRIARRARPTRLSADSATPGTGRSAERDHPRGGGLSGRPALRLPR